MFHVYVAVGRWVLTSPPLFAQLVLRQFGVPNRPSAPAVGGVQATMDRAFLFRSGIVLDQVGSFLHYGISFRRPHAFSVYKAPESPGSGGTCL